MNVIAQRAFAMRFWIVFTDAIRVFAHEQFRLLYPLPQDYHGPTDIRFHLCRYDLWSFSQCIENPEPDMPRIDDASVEEVVYSPVQL